jgi:hypothetical protein
MQPPSSELDLAHIALIAAHGRFLGDHASRDIGAWYASLGETLWWIFALDEYYRNLYKEVREVYERFRDGNKNGCVISGLRLARNRVGHGLALMLEDPSGRSVFDVPQNTEGAIIIDQLMWRALDDLPEVDEAHKRPAQENAYRRYLEGNAARYPLRRAGRFFIRGREELDSLVLRTLVNSETITAVTPERW